MVKLESEVFDIEDLLLQDNDDKTELIIPVNGKKYRLYVTQVTYGEIKKMERLKTEEEKTNFILENHVFNGKGEEIPLRLIQKFPAGLLKAISEVIMDKSGMNVTKEELEVF